MSTFLSIDWRAVLAVCGILAALLLLIAWNHKQNPHTGGLWLSHSALSLELLGLALSLFWAVNAPDGAILPIIFVAGWIGMLIGRAVLINYSVNAWQRHKFGIVTGAWITLLIAYIALYGSGLFHAVNDSANAAYQRLEASRPALALDSEIEATRARIVALAGFADAGKAHAEESAAAAASADFDARQRQLQADLAAARERLAGCPANHKTRCINPARAEIASLESQLSGLSPAATSSGYASRHAEYTGLQQHLVALEQKRAELSLAGQGAAQAWKAEDRMLAWLFGIEPETASRVKWLVATAIFDILSLLFRIFAAIALGKNDPETLARRRLDTLLAGGFSVGEAAALAGGTSAASGASGEDEPHQPPASSQPAQTMAFAPNRKYRDMLLYGTTDNGIADNGMTGNGMTGNGMADNGMTGNGMAGNGMADNGMTDNGMTGRQKGAQAPCVDCGTIITLRSKSHKRCPTCREKHEAEYRKKHSAR